MSDDSSDQEDAEQSGQKPVHQKTVRSDAPSASSSSRAPKRKTTEGNISQEEMDEILAKTGAEEREDIGGREPIPSLHTDAYNPVGSDNSPEREEDSDEEEIRLPYRPIKVKSKMHPYFTANDLFRYYNMVLKQCPLSDRSIQEVFDYDEITNGGLIPLEQYSSTRYKHLRDKYKGSSNVHRSTLDFFFGYLSPDPEHTDLYQCYCMDRLLMNGIISDYQREMILFILLADYYKHGANNAEDDTLVLEWNQSIDAVLEDAQRTGGPLPLPSQITASDSSRTLTVQRLEWYDHSMNQTGIKPCWPLLYAFWWVSKNNGLFNDSESYKNPSKRDGRGNYLHPPPRYEQLHAVWINELLHGTPVLRMPVVWNIRHPQEAWQHTQAHRNVKMGEVLFCYNPFRGEPQAEIIDFYDLIRESWASSKKLYALALEDTITWMRIEAQMIAPHYDVHNINMHTFWYLVRQPYSYRFLERLSPLTEFGRRFAYQKKTVNYQSVPIPGGVSRTERRPHTFTTRKDTWSSPDLRMAELPEGVPTPVVEKTQTSGTVVPPVVELTQTAIVVPPPPPVILPTQGQIPFALGGSFRPPVPGALPIDDPRRKSLMAPQVHTLTIAPDPASSTIADQLAYYKKAFEDQQRATMLMSGIPNQSSAGMGQSSGSLGVMVATKEERLRGPTYGQTWDNYPYKEAFRLFEENLVANHRDKDLLYRKQHIDKIWLRELDTSFRHEYMEQGYHWEHLDHDTFFDQLRKFYIPRTMSTVTGGFQTISNVYTSKAEEFIEAKKRKFFIWDGNYPENIQENRLTYSNYVLLEEFHHPTAEELSPYRRRSRMEGFRHTLYSKAQDKYRSEKDVLKKPSLLAYLIIVDKCVHVGQTRETIKDKLALVKINEPITSEKLSPTYPKQSPLDKSVMIEDYLKALEIVGDVLAEMILAPALALGLKVPGLNRPGDDTDSRNESRGTRDSREQGGHDRNRSQRDNRPRDSRRDDNQKGGQQPRPRSRSRERAPSRLDSKQVWNKYSDKDVDIYRPIDQRKSDGAKDDKTTESCNSCGRKGHDWDKCILRIEGKHPDVNKNKDMKFADSEEGKEWAKQHQFKTPWRKSYSDSNYVNPITPKNELNERDKPFHQKERDSKRSPSRDRQNRSDSQNRSEKGPRENKDRSRSRDRGENKSRGDSKDRRDRSNSRKCKSEETTSSPAYSFDNTLCMSRDLIISNNVLDMLGQFPVLCVIESEDQHDPKAPLLIVYLSTPLYDLHRDVECLVDTGALDRNYVSKEIGKELVAKGAHLAKCDVNSICTCTSTVCLDCLGVVTFTVHFHNEISKKDESFDLTATIIQSDFDLILGRVSIYEHDLLFKAYNQIFADLINPTEPYLDQRLRRQHIDDLLVVSNRNKTTPSPPGFDVPTQVPDASIPETSGSPRLAVVKAKEEMLSYVPKDIADANKISDERVVRHREHLIGGSGPRGDEELYGDSDDEWDPIKGNSDPGQTFVISGPPSLQIGIKKLLTKYADVFSDKLTKQCALVPPMELKVDENQWHTQKNRRPHRPVSNTKQQEIRKQTDDMVNSELIRPSNSDHWSQVLMVPKPNGSWRFCVDFRQLNDVSKAEGWPLPNIKQLLNRIGSSRAKYFAIMDLTKGFYQTPLSEQTKAYTAFICFCGLFEWNRVPMGLKGAPSYFQRILATIVLVNLIHVILELYIDDVIVHGKDEKEFLDHLEKTLRRFRQFLITVNPAKCKFGLSEVDYVGHVIDPMGLTFSKDKRDKVRQFPLPQNMKHLRSYLGLCNYFRDHIPHHSEMMLPLQEMILQYEKTKRLVWTLEATASFERSKNAVADCAKLYFLNDDINKHPVFLMTDASDYGLGGYLYQVVDGKEMPIQFISKTFDETQLKWSTNEKEAYAIIYSIRKLDPLLRDIYFTLKTDHKNLIYICDHASAKVGRWKMDLQEYNFDVEHIPGVENVVADACSRLCALTNPKEKREGYKRFAVPPSYALASLATLAEPDSNQISPFVTPLWLHDLLGSIHGTNTGHWGVDLLYKRAREKLDAQNKKVANLKAHCRQFVRKCPCCQKMSQLRTPILAQKFTLSTYTPMERIYADSIGPLPADEKDNKYILVIIDAFTRWIELYAIPDTTAEIAARCLLDWTGRFGTPIQIMSDGGSQFVNELWEAYSELLGTQKIESFAGSHEENGIVERANKEVMRHLRAIVFDKKLQTKDWSIYLPLVQRIMNGHPVGVTGISPAQLLFGNAVSLNERILPAVDDGSVIQRTLTAATSDMLTWQSHLIQQHEQLLRSHDAQHIATPFDSQKKIISFPVGSYVLVEYDNTAIKGRGPPHKLMPFLRGPYRVVNNVGSRYTLLDLVTNKHTDVLFHRLHPFLYDKARMDPKEAACRDREEYEVERILGHSGDPRKKSEMKFFVKWKGYDDPKENTWEPWKTLRLVDKLHDYLEQNNMKNLIPKDCRREQSPEPSRRAQRHVRFSEQDNQTFVVDSRENSPTRRSSRTQHK